MRIFIILLIVLLTTTASAEIPEPSLVQVTLCDLYKVRAADIGRLKNIQKNISKLELNIFGIQLNKDMLELLARRHVVIPEQETARIKVLDRLIVSFRNQIRLLEKNEEESKGRIGGADKILEFRRLNLTAEGRWREEI
ncbi:hypothetical protein A2671_02305 [Candidatus Kaiserbacteria bacterium RIFCSPHIGHO2_01_FULL_49_13]|uniref:Uncharacterized protein n=1 Tax=Candidatus Kaiserbacteria bacterium RIFCSPHIGHO2_01_FULL_49_13 TaxID=1798477 RepID=A0A1F6CDU9_9BACT|nr:MAG: hypothetical protein A2671_02305 [Candidatus Kaiserbacteria bacterium RIFCSPHIGHO2_01_FULL_49_13]